MSRKLRFDRTLFATGTLLPLFGLMMIYSASILLAERQFNDPYHFLFRQVFSVLIGFAALLTAMHIDYRHYEKSWFVYGLFLGSCLLLVTTLLINTGHTTHRWLRAGPFSFQPSELAKLALVFVLAYQLSKRKGSVNDPLTSLPCLLVLAMLSFLAYQQPDLGTALSFVLIGFLLLFVAGLPIRHLMTAGMGTLVLLVCCIFQRQYWLDRILTWFNPEADLQGLGFQINQSRLAIGSGGLTGLSLGDGRQKLFFLPEPHTDFIFSIIGEELGFLGAVVVLVAFGLLLWRGVVSSLRAPCLFGRYLAAGITFSIFFQALANILVALGLLPTTGLTLPLISYGGSSLVVTMLSLGILLNISQHAR